MIAYCPRCGAEFPMVMRVPGIAVMDERCSDCGVTVADPVPMMSPSGDDDEVDYDLGEWPVEERAAATFALAAAEIPYRWEPGLVLVIPEVAETEVDLILDELDDSDDSDDKTIEDAVDDEDETGQAQVAMADLFVAADRLQHAPDDASVSVEAERAAAIMGASSPPYGIERPVWKQMQALAAALVGAIDDAAEGESAEGDVVATAARAVRDFLRDYV